MTPKEVQVMVIEGTCSSLATCKTKGAKKKTIVSCLICKSKVKTNSEWWWQRVQFYNNEAWCKMKSNGVKLNWMHEKFKYLDSFRNDKGANKILMIKVTDGVCLIQCPIHSPRLVSEMYNFINLWIQNFKSYKLFLYIACFFHPQLGFSLVKFI